MILRIKIIGVFVVIAILLVGMAIFVYLKGIPKPCQEDWACAPWSECINDTKTRMCTDKNNCGTAKDKPVETDFCESPIFLCGNSVCDKGENCKLCQDDCGKCVGEICIVDEMCESKYCVHNVCRAESTYCGDRYCDTGEICSSCSQDCGICLPSTPTISVSLTANPSSGTAPLNGVDLIADVSGTATGSINYTFYCDRPDTRTNITSGWCQNKASTTQDPYTATDCCNFSSAGTYTAKVIAERGTLQAEARTNIQVNPQPGCIPSWSGWENQGCGLSCGDVGVCQATEQCQKKSDGCGNYQYQCVIDTECKITLEIKKEHILNFLSYWRNSYNSLGLLDFAFTLDSYELLETEVPNKTQAIEYLNSKQSSEGTWNTGKSHYVPTTAQILMFYNRSRVKPPKSLAPFFSTIDTWEEVNAHVNKYDSGNYWGGLWGYVVSYVVYKGEAPPWANEFYKKAKEDFNTWVYSSHQRTHLVMNLYHLGLPIPRVDDVTKTTLQQQKGDGSWDYHEAETVFNIGMLNLLRAQTTIDKNLIDSAISRGVEYVKKSYKTVDSEGKTYGTFVKNPTENAINGSPWYTALGIFAVLNPKSDIWLRWFATNLLQNETGHIDNSLEYLMARGLGVHDMANYVISKSYLGTQIPNKTQIINYFDNNQNQTDGSWSDAWTPMFTTHRVLLAYNILNATPKYSLDSFFSKYDTWSEAKNYMLTTGSGDARNMYHVIFAWVLYYQNYPPWLNDFFNEVEKDLTWTTGTNSHKRTHILYSYVMARRQFPNLDEIINETLREQSADGHWDYQCLSTPRPVYCNAIQLILLQQIIKLYPTYRTTEIQNSIDKSRQWVYDTYNTTTVNGVVMGYFGTAINIEDSLMTGIIASGINGLMDINVDMTFSDLVSRISQ